jgi:predicted nucleic acid-binding protein
MPELVIADASCLIALSNLGELDLLRKIYGRVVLTPTVVDEYRLDLSDWMDVDAPKDAVKLAQLQQLVDRGEASAIALAIERPGCRLILDDAKGRKCAEAEGLRITGTVGILLKAHHQGLLSVGVEPALVRLRGMGSRISDALYKEAMRLAR